MKTVISGYINMFLQDGMYQSSSSLFETKETAMETGKLVRGYVATVPVTFEY